VPLVDKEKHRVYVRQYSRKRRESNLEKSNAYQLEYQRKWRAANAEYYREYMRKYHLKNKERRCELQRKSKGLPLPNRPCPETCECCGGLPGKNRLHLDHCHETGEFRGWLCSGCNRAIGLLGDTEMALLKALSYLRTWKSIGGVK
jgi:hypothetical protein